MAIKRRVVLLVLPLYKGPKNPLNLFLLLGKDPAELDSFDDPLFTRDFSSIRTVHEATDVLPV